MALVILSGGQDSTTCLYWARDIFGEISAVTFDYGQRHRIEIESAKKIAFMAGVKKHFIQDAKFINDLSPSALTRDIEIKTGKGLPNTFVPGRNLFFISMAAVIAKNLGYDDLVTGVCQTDYSGYPDCRKDFIISIEKTIRCAMDWPGLDIWTPLMRRSKAEAIDLAQRFPGCMEALAYSHTCYEGKYPPCGKCPACLIRAKGFEEARIADPLIERYNKEAK